MREAVAAPCALPSIKASADVWFAWQPAISRAVALTSFEDPALVERALELSISREVSRSDSFFTLSGAAVNPNARTMLWNWLTKRYDQLNGIYAGSQSFFLLLDQIIPRCGIGHEAEVHKFVSGKRYKEGETTFRRTFELLGINSRLRKRLLAS